MVCLILPANTTHSNTNKYRKKLYLNISPLCTKSKFAQPDRAAGSFTVVLGVIPLHKDAFWYSISVTIMSGLAFGTILTMVVVPVLFAFFCRLKAPVEITKKSIFKLTNQEDMN